MVLLLAKPTFAANIIHEFYVPMPEAQARTALVSIEPASGIVGTTMESVISIIGTGAGTVIHYDEWEDGYEIDINNPTQSTTKIWGDGNNANGIPPGYANDPASFPSGAVINLRNLVTLPRNPSTILYDGRDRFGGTKALVVTRTAWATAPGTVLAGSVEVTATMDYGTSYVSPVGQDVSAASMFEYVGLMVMARENGTSVTVDINGPVSGGATTFTLNQGESYLVNGGILKGATVTSTKPVQTQLITGDIGARYETDWFTLYPVDQWTGTYYSPVGTAQDGDQTYGFFYNPTGSALTINTVSALGTGSFSIPANGVYQYQMPQNSGSKFTSVGNVPFFGLVMVGANPSANNVHDWGFTLVPSDSLTTEAVVGWGPGSSDLSSNGSPVWVTPVSDTRIYVDYNGDRNGANTDPKGNKYDVHYDLTALTTKLLFDPDKDQSAMRVYTLEGAQITAAWGQDPNTAGPGNPFLDVGTTVLPFPVPTLIKAVSIITDTAPTGFSIGDTIEYRIDVDNKGLLPLGNLLVLDPLNPSLTYVTNSTKRDGVAIADGTSGTPFPLDESGYVIPIILRGGTTNFTYRCTINSAGSINNTASNTNYNLTSTTEVNVPPGGGSTACGAVFTNSTGTTQTSYSAGSSVYATMTDPDANNDTGVAETITVVINNTSNGDAEFVTLTETGVNTGIFRNLTGLPTSTSTGTNQMDGTLLVAPGNSLSFTYTDPEYNETCTGNASISVPTQNKYLYLDTDGTDGDTSGDLDRVDPVASSDGSTSSTGALAVPSSGTITAGTTTSATNTGLTVTFTHAANTGTDRLLVLTIGMGTATANPGTPGTISSVTFAGTAMTQLGTAYSSDGARAYIYVLKDDPGTSYTMPASGSIVITSSASDTRIVAGATTFTGVHQTTSYGTLGSNTNAGSTAVSVGATSAAGELVVGVTAIDEGGTNQSVTTSTTGGQVQLWNLGGNNFVTGAGSTKPGAAGTVTLSFTGAPSSDWAALAVSLKPAPASGGSTTATFTQTPSFASTFTMPSGSTPAVTAYYTVSSGSMPGTPSITADLKKNGTTFATSTGATASGGLLTFNFGSLGSAQNFAASDVMSLVVTTAQSGVTFTLDYDSSTMPSKITLPTTTVINVDSLAVYDAPYPGGSVITAPASGTTVYIRSTASDPFGAYDITGMGLSVDGPGTSADITTTLGAGQVVDTGTGTKTYEYPWVVGSTTGTYNIVVTAQEGTEGIQSQRATSVNVTFLDLGTPSITEFTTGLNGPGTPTYAGNEQVCVRITDLDQDLSDTTVENITAVITAASGDSELVTLTETGVHTGVFVYCIPASTTTGSSHNDGTLKAVLGEVLTVVYVDPTDSTDTSNDTATVPNIAPAVSVNKTLITPADGIAVIGESISYQVQVTNTGNTTLSSVALTDTYPAAKLTYVSSSLTPSSTSSGSINWTNVGPLAQGQSVTITLNFTALATSAPATNAASADAGGGVTGGDTADVTITDPKITISKTLLSPNPGPANINDNVVFRITVTNTGDTAIATLPIEDTFSGADFDFLSATVAPDASGNGSLLWLDVTGAGNLAPSGSTTIDVTLKAKGTAVPATNLAAANYTVDVNGDSAPPVQSSATITLVAAKITGHVYDDVNTNGTYQSGTDGFLENVTVSLYTDPNGDGNPADGTLVAITTTDAAGSFEFLNLPAGNYVAVESQPPGYSSSGDSAGANDNRIPLVISTLTTYANNNFFDFLTPPVSYASIAGKVWNDANASTTVNGGEAGIENVQIDLVEDTNNNGSADPGEPVISSTLTAANGTYSFTGLSAGNYVVVEHDLFGWYSTADSAGANDNQVPVTLTSGQNATSKDFLDVLTGTTGGKVFNDVNGNGTFDAGVDSPLVGIDVLVTDSMGAVQTVTTDASGDWTATVPPGGTDIDVDENDPDFTAVYVLDYTQTAGTDSTVIFAVSGVNTPGGDDGFRQVAAVTGHLYKDTNGNGTQNPGEPNLAGVDVVISDVDGTLQTVTTDVDGNWSALVPPGSTSANIDQTDPDYPASSTITQGQDTTSITAVANVTTGSTPVGIYIPATVTGHLYRDTNGNGTQNGGEPSLAGIDVLVTDSIGHTQTVTTDASGNWTATVPPGTTTANIDETDPQYPAGGVITQGADTTSITAVAAVSTGSTPVGIFQPATISGVVRSDNGHDGGGDTAYQSASVKLYTDPNGDGDPSDGAQWGSTATTDPSGAYSFTDVPPGDYVVVLQSVSGYVLEKDGDTSTPADDVANASILDSQIPVTVTGTETDNGNDFIIEHVTAIGNAIFRDANGNGVFDSGEGVVGVKVQLFNSSNVQVDEVTSITGGLYSFTNVTPGSYYVLVPASEFGVGKPLRGLISVSGVQAGDDNLGEDGIDNASPAINGIRTALFTVLPGTAPTDATTETGTAKTSDNADDANSDLTIDLGYACPSISVGGVSISITVGTPYDQTIAASGGTAPYTYTTSDTLPAGLTLESNGQLHGTPSSTTSRTFTVNVLDAVGCSSSRSFTLAPVCPTITLSTTPASLPAAVNGTPYTATINASGGTPNYTFAITGGALPNGLTLASNGDISGTPSAASNSFNFTVEATDSYGCKGSAGFTISLDCPTITISPSALLNGTVGVAYGNVDFTATGGTAPYVWTQGGSTSLPTGMSFNTSTARLSGTPTDVGSWTLAVIATDANGCAASVNLTFSTSCPTVTITGTLPAAVVNAPYDYTLTGSGGTSPYVFSTSDTLPTGLVLESDGQLHGTPTSTVSRTFTINVTDANGCPGSRSFTLAPSCPTLSLAPASLDPATVNAFYTQTITASGGIAPYTFTTSDTLPAGLTLTSGGVLSGTPTSTASVTFTINVTDANNCPGSLAFTLAPSCPTISIAPTTLPAATVNAFYTQTLTASGGVGTYTFSTSDTLPAGLTLSPGGVLSGTPTSTTSRTFTVNVTDSNNCPGSRTFTLAPSCPTITLAPATLPNGTVNAAYDETITASGGIAPYTFATSDTLPTGLTLETTGQLHGIPTSTTSRTFTVTATDANNCTGTLQFTVAPACPMIAIAPTTAPAGVVGTVYSHTFNGTGGITPYSFSVTAGTLPAGLTLSSAGVLGGTPTEATSQLITITVRDANNCPGTLSLTITTSCPTITLAGATGPLPAATNGTAYTATIQASGGTADYSFEKTSGDLPNGLVLNADGTITGTPNAMPGTYTFAVRATDTYGCQGSGSFSITVNCATIAISPTTLSNGTAGVLYPTVTFSTTGTQGTLTWQLASGSLPSGMNFNTTNGTLGGTPTETGTYPFSISVTDQNGCGASVSLSITIGCPVIAVAPVSLDPATVNAFYTQTITASNGIAPYSFSTSDTLPAGLTLSSAGVLSGTPTSTASRTFTISVTDANNCPGSATFTLAPSCPAISLAPASLPAPTVNAFYTQTITASNGIAPYTFSTSDTLPAGLTLSSGGVLSGTPTSTASVTFTINVTDANNCPGSRTFTLAPSCPTISLAPSSLPNATVGAFYSQQLTASGGVAPYSYAITVGLAPDGFTLSPTGLISGTTSGPTGDANFTVTVTDANNCTVDVPLTITVVCNTLAVSPTSLTNAVVGMAYGPYQLTTTGSNGAVAWSVLSGTLPPGITLNPSSGVVSGVPTATGTASFTVKATDANGCIGTVPLAITTSCPTITLASSPVVLPGATNGTAYTGSIVASGSTGSYTYTLAGGTLPNGLTLNGDGTITGTPSAASGAYPFTVEAEDGYACTGTGSFTISVGCPTITIAPTTLAHATAGVAYTDVVFTASGGTAPYTWTKTSGTLPAGMTFTEATATLAGTPTEAGTFTFALAVSDANSCGASVNLTLIVDCPTIAITPATLPDGVVNEAYDEQLVATGGVGTMTFTYTGTLPAGLTLESNGQLHGTPTSTAASTFTIVAKDLNLCPGSRTFTLTPSCPTISIAPTTLPAATVNAFYTQTLTAGGGVGTYTFSTSDTLPTGLTLSPTGVLSGTPTSTTSRTFTVSVADANNCPGSRTFTLAPSCPTITLAPATLPNGTVNAAYDETITASGGIAPYTFATSDTLPAGLTLETTGQLHGIPTSTTSRTFTVTATDANNCTATRDFTVAPACPTIAIAPTTAPAGVVGTVYSRTFVGGGGIAPYTFSTTDTLPAGLTLSPSGVLSGTPTEATSLPITINVRDANNCPASLSLTLTTTCPTLTLAGATGPLPAATNGTPYSATIEASGGTPDYSFIQIGDNLPNGLTLSGDGSITGVPNAFPGSYFFLVKATDLYGCASTQAFTITVSCATVSIAPTTLANGSAGVLYPTVTFTSSGTQGTLTWVQTGALPAGMTFNDTTATLSGTPTTTGTYPLSISVTDQNGCGSSVNLTLTINCPAIVLSPTSLPAATVNALYDQTITATGGVGVYNFTTTDTLPTGLVLETTGQLHGIPTSVTSRTFTITATDENGCTGTRTFTIAPACPTITIAPTSLPDGMVNAAYDETISASGGVAPYTFATAQTLPTGLVLETTGQLHGIPTSNVARTFTVVATDANGCAGSLAFTITPSCPTISIAPAALPNGVVNAPYDELITASGGVGAYAFTTSDVLPTGLVLEASGQLHGTPTSVVPRTFTVVATDVNGCPGSLSFTITPACPTISIAPASLPAATVNAFYTQTLTASGGVGTYTFSTSDTLPAGLTLTPGGLLSGTPTSTTSRTFTINVTDANGCPGSRTFTLAPSCPTITLAPGSLPNGVVGSAYDETITASGGITAYTFSTTDVLPAGLTLESNGRLHGTPTSTTSRIFTVTATDANGCTGSLAFTVAPSCPTITLSTTPAVLPAAVNGTAYNAAINASGGTPDYTFGVLSGTLPNGLTLNSDGTITGTPSAATASFTFTVLVTDFYGCSAQAIYTISLDCPTITISPSALLNGTVGVAYGNVDFTATGGTAPYVWTQGGSTSLPTGMSFNTSTARLSGTPTDVGSWTLAVIATDANGCAASVNLTFSTSCPTVTITGTLPAAVVNAPYDYTLTGSGGTSPYVFSTSDTLPTGLVLESDGQLHGTPTSTVSRTFTINVTDANGCPGSRSFTLAPSCPTLSLAPASLDPATVNAFYTQTITASGGIAPYTFTTSDTLPAGLTLTSGGVLSGTPTSTASVTFTINVTDANNCPGSLAFTLAPSCPTISIAPTTLPAATVNAFYTQTLTASGGVGTYTFSTSDTLPAGLTLSPGGVLSGTPTSTTSRTFTVNVTDSNNCPGSRTFTLAPSCPTITLAPATLPNGTVNAAYDETITASGGIAPYTFATSDTLPTGLTLETTGQLHGIPTSTTSRTFTVTATDANNCTGTLQFTVAPACPTIAIAPTTAPAGVVGTLYSQTFTGSGGIAPYTFSTTDTLPAGLALSPSGVLSGTPTEATSLPITINVRDANNCPASLSLTLTTTCPTIIVSSSPAALPSATNGTPYSAAITAAGGTADYTFSVISGSLPAGLTMASDGAISGTPGAAAGAYPFTVSVDDMYGCQGQGSFIINVDCPTITIAPTTLANGTTGVLYPTVTFTSSGTTGTLTWMLTGSLPSGLTFSTTTATLSGTPTAAGTYPLTIAVIDQNGCGATVNLSLVIACPAIAINPTTLPAAVVNTAYNELITATGGSAPYTFTTTDTLPTGLVLETTGQLHGIPTSVVSRTFTVNVTDVNGCPGSRTFTLAPSCPTITLAPATLPNGTVNTAYSQMITASGGVGAYTFTTTDTLPEGLTLETNGQLHGTPLSTTSRTFTIVVTDDNGCTGSLAFTVTPACPVITLAPDPLPTATVNTLYSQTITATGGIAPYTFSATGTLPAGLTLETTGQLHGLPTSTATRTFTITATDVNGCTGTLPCTLTPSCPTITILPALPPAMVNQPFDYTIPALGGIAPYTFATADTLPAGLTLEANGRLHGVPTSTISRTFTVTVTDANLCPASQPFTLAPSCPTITLAPAGSLPAAVVGSDYDVTITANGGIAPYTFTTSDPLPAGLTLESTGRLHGTPTSAAPSFFMVTATDANGCSGFSFFAIAPSCPTITLASSPAVLPGAVNGTPYSAGIVASGGTPDYTYGLVGGSLPNGLTLNSDGTITGTPSSPAGSFGFFVNVTDKYGCPAVAQFFISLNCPTITITPATLTNATAGVAYGPVQFVASGGSNPYTWQQTGTLPNGITFNTTNATLGGTPTQTGTFSFSIVATDTNQCSANVNLSLTVVCPVITVTPVSLAPATVNAAYSQSIGATGGIEPYIFSTSDTLPTGLTLDPDGMLHGTPTSTTSRTFTVNVTDANGCPGSRSFTLAPACPTIALAPASLPNGTVNAAYDVTITASGGVGTYTFVTAQTLPAGLVLETTGRLHGTPTSTTSHTFTVVATDDNGCTGSLDFTIVPSCPTITVNPVTLPNGTVNAAYDVTLTASGGVGAYSFTTADTLPAGLTLESDGQLHGTPTSTTSRTFTVNVTDANGCPGSRQFTVAPACPTISLQPLTLPAGVVGTAYSQTITASGGIAPYGFTVTNGTLPNGLVLAANGELSGTPTEAVSRVVEVTATDANGCTGLIAYTLTTSCPTITINPNVLPNGVVGQPYLANVIATGGTPDYEFTVTGGTLPAGLTLDLDGTLHGTPASTASATFVITATDMYGCTGSLSFVITPACPVITLTSLPASLPQGTIGTPYPAASIGASGGTGPYTYTQTGGIIPAGLTLQPNGSITGTPTGPAVSFTFTAKATDFYGCAGTGVFTIGIDCPVLNITPATLPNAVANQNYSVFLTAGNASGAVTWTLEAGSLPQGIFLDGNSGEIYGTPIFTGTVGFTIKARDIYGCVGTINLAITTTCPTITITPPTLFTAAVRTSYDAQLYASGGTDPYVFSITGGELPPGLTMDADGHISGMPAAGGDYSFTVTVNDLQGCAGSASLSITVKTATIHGHLYVDTNGNGHQEVTEPALADVDVVINESGGATQTVHTNSVGDWSATVPPGITVADVKETDPQFVAALPTYTQTEGSDPTVDIAIADADTDFLNDGYYVPAQLHGHVYIDYNGNALHDLGEPNLTSVTVRILDSNNVTHTTQTGVDGDWAVTVPPGPATVTVDESDIDFTSNVPGAYTETDGTNPNTVTAVAAADTNAGNDGYFIPGTLHGHVYLDTNGNGTQNSGEPNIANVDVIVTDVNLVPHTVTTDPNGNWTVQLAPGDASAKVQTSDPDFPSGVTQSEGTDPTLSVVIINGNVDGGTDGYKPLPGLYAISGQVRDDYDVDGEFTDNDTPVPGVVIKLWLDVNGDGQLDGGDALLTTTTTNGNGQYSFTGLSNGKYLVQEVDPRPSESTNDAQGAPDDNLIAVTIAGANVVTRDFLDAVDPHGYIYDSVTGVIVPGGSVAVSGPGSINLVMNGSNGEYSFITDGTAGTYVITFTPPPGYRVDPNRPAHAGAFDPTGLPDPVVMGSSESTTTPGQLADFSAGANVYYLRFDLAAGDPLVINNNLPVVLIKPNTFTYWKYLTPGTGTGPDSNDDCDYTDDLLEYGLCGNPATAVQTRPLFIVQKNVSTGLIDASFKRPQGVTDVSYTLQLLTNLANSPAGWTPTTLTPVVTSNGDGSETVTYSNLEGDPFFTSSPNQGFARLKVAQLGAPNATATTQCYGWTHRLANSVCESFSMPYLKPEIFAGCVASVVGNTITAETSVGVTDIAAQFVSGQKYFIEVMDGPHEGQRWEVDEAASTATSLVIETSTLNTSATVPSTLAESRIAVRAHWLMGELFDKNAFLATTSLATTDRLLFHNNANSSFTVYYRVGNAASALWFLPGGPAVDQSSRIVDNDEGMLVHPRAGSVPLLLTGLVRSNAFAMPLSTNDNFIGSGWPMTETPSGRTFTVANGFTGNRNPVLADRLMFWKGDNSLTDLGWTSHFLLSYNALQQWVPQGNATLNNENDAGLFVPLRGCLMRSLAGKPGLVMPMPWTP